MVTASALANIPASPLLDDTPPFLELQRRIPLPDHLDHRVAMIAPAIGADPVRPLKVTRLILGVNEDDPVLSKMWLPSWAFGSTELGCNLDLARDVAGEEGVVDLEASTVHDFKDYLLRREMLRTILPRLFSATKDP